MAAVKASTYETSKIEKEKIHSHYLVKTDLVEKLAHEMVEEVFAERDYGLIGGL